MNNPDMMPGQPRHSAAAAPDEAWPRDFNFTYRRTLPMQNVEVSATAKPADVVELKAYRPALAPRPALDPDTRYLVLRRADGAVFAYPLRRAS